MDVVKKLAEKSSTWLVTGCAGFIGSNLVEYLLLNHQKVIGVDNLLTGQRGNFSDIESQVGKQLYANFKFIEADLQDYDLCEQVVSKSDFILHQAALGSVPRSIDKPLDTHKNNVDTFTNMVCALVKTEPKPFVYASSSSVYGDHPELPKIENKVGQVLSPYALSKKINEEYATVFGNVYTAPMRGLRYFNVFGRRQNPEGAYAAVIPRWVRAMIKNDPVYIFGDGETSRDFTHVENVIQANLKAALCKKSAEEPNHQVFNVAMNGRTTLNDLYWILNKKLSEKFDHIREQKPIYQDFRKGDVRHSQANVDYAMKELSYSPEVSLDQGITKTLDWYVENLS